MKKFTLLFSVVLLITLSFYSCEQSQIDPADPESSDFVETKPMNKIDNPKNINYCFVEEKCLWAGQHIDAGSVTIGNDDDNLYVTVYSEEGYDQSIDPETNQPRVEQIKIDIVTKLPDSRPAAGHFPYKYTTITDEKSVTFQIPFSELSEYLELTVDCSYDHLYVLVHADVIADGEGETAWGGCDEGKGSAWWYTIDYSPNCCECWCGFGNDYQNDDDACLSMMFEGEKYIFWSNKYNFDDMNGKEHKVSLLVNPNMCEPQDIEGSMVDLTATEVGTVALKAYEGDDGKPYVDVIYTLKDKYKGYKIQLDLYIGEDKIPQYDLQERIIKTDETHMLYQHKLDQDENTYTFERLPWLYNGESLDTYISLHAAIGECPMPSLQNPMPY